jgi:hypothetical protein
VVLSEQEFGFFHVAVEIAELLAVHPHFGEEYFPFMALFLQFVLFLFADLLALGALLRFKPLAKLGIKTEVS